MKRLLAIIVLALSTLAACGHSEPSFTLSQVDTTSAESVVRSIPHLHQYCADVKAGKDADQSKYIDQAGAIAMYAWVEAYIQIPEVFEAEQKVCAQVLGSPLPTTTTTTAPPDSCENVVAQGYDSPYIPNCPVKP